VVVPELENLLWWTWSKSQGLFNRNQWLDVWLVWLVRATLGLYENAALKCT